MPVFVEITPDPFAEQFNEERALDKSFKGLVPDSSQYTYSHVRRPVRGIQIKGDTHASLQVRTAGGVEIPLADGGGTDDPKNPGTAHSYKYSNFLLQAIQESRAEKTQVVQTFGEPFIFFFGEHPRVIQGTGQLLNTEDFNWRAEFWHNYENHLRGTKCVQNRTRVTLAWDDIVIEGYFIAANATEDAKEPNYVNFDFQIFLTNYQNVSAIGASDFPSQSFEGHIDPTQIDIPGLAVLPVDSSTRLVRQLNIEEPTAPVKSSLFKSLVDGISKIASFDGSLVDLFSLTSGFVDGNKRVRVPRGFAGANAFDDDTTQIALASIDPNATFVNIAQDDYYIFGRKGTTSLPVKFGKFSDSVDEYIARFPGTSNSPSDPIRLFDDQLIGVLDIEPKIRDVYAKFGLNVDPSQETINLAKNSAFGTTQEKSTSNATAAASPAFDDPGF